MRVEGEGKLRAQSPSGGGYARQSAQCTHCGSRDTVMASGGSARDGANSAIRYFQCRGCNGRFPLNVCY